MSHIDGVGGAFIFSHDARTLAQWYRDYLGMTLEGVEEYGAFYQVFYGLDPDDHSRRLDTTFSIMPAAKSLPPPRKDDHESDNMYGDQPFMVNLRVRDLDGLIAEMEAKGVAIIKRQDEVYGKFAGIRDSDGNRIELYEPIPPK